MIRAKGGDPVDYSVNLGPDATYEIMIPVEDQHETLSEIFIPVKNFAELVSIIAGVKQVGGLYIEGMSEGTPNRIYRVEIAVSPEEKRVRGIIMLDDQMQDQYGN
ncbi:MAG: hypothetical protein AVO34_05205 [Firmicutes bacterium ML8_F2]|jgi:hypothetical protein|nr:MAG: hypothetical protein AVO34_05205 [Firmicutes bacterium ML8_F2]